MNDLSVSADIPLTGEKWAAKSEAYASLIAEHLTPTTVWLDAGCGTRLLEDDMDPTEDWLASHCRRIFGMDISVTRHRNIDALLSGSLYDLPFPDRSLDVITCRMVIEHLDQPLKAFREALRCLRPGGAVIVITPNLLNYGIFGNAIATKMMPENLRLRIVQGSDARAAADIFPVRYKANTLRSLQRAMCDAGLQVHKAASVRQLNPYWPKLAPLERVLMKLTPSNALLVCAHRPA